MCTLNHAILKAFVTYAAAWAFGNMYFIFSHDCPTSDKKILLGGAAKSDELNQYLEQVKQRVDYKKWFFGHYHQNMNLPGGKDIAVYEVIVQIH